MTPIYVTVNYYGEAPVASRPICQGCTVVESNFPEPAEYRLVGASAAIDLCRRCVIHSIKSFAARFMMFDPSATRDLLDFFAVEASKKRPTAKRSAANGKRRARKKVIDVVAPLQLEGKKSP